MSWLDYTLSARATTLYLLVSLALLALVYLWAWRHDLQAQRRSRALRRRIGRYC